MKNEDSTFTYKLAVVQLCVNAANQFVGMRSVVAKILNGQVVATSLTPLNRIGSVTDFGTTCSSLIIDYISGDFVQNMTLWTNTTNVVRVAISTNNGTVLSRGTAGTRTKSESLVFTSDEQLLAFWGDENDSLNVVAIGPIKVRTKCTVLKEDQ